MFDRRLTPNLPGLKVASVPLIGWSLLNVDSAFSARASDVIGQVAPDFDFPHLLQSTRLSHSRQLPAVVAHLVPDSRERITQVCAAKRRVMARGNPA
jgi:hypothetical protein